MKYELKSIGFWSFLRIAFALNLLAGLVGGFLFTPVGFIMYSLAQAGDLGVYGGYSAFEPEDGSGVGALFIFIPLVMAVGASLAGTFFQCIVVGIYNLLARMLGGIELKLILVETDTSAETTAGTSSKRTIVPPPPPPPGARPTSPASATPPPPPPPPGVPTSPPTGTKTSPADSPQPPRPQTNLALPPMNTYPSPPKFRSNDEKPGE